MLALVELNFDDLVGKDCAYGGCVHAVAEASMKYFAGKQLFLAPLAEHPSFEEGLSFQIERNDHRFDISPAAGFTNRRDNL